MITIEELTNKQLTVLLEDEKLKTLLTKCGFNIRTEALIKELRLRKLKKIIKKK